VDSSRLRTYNIDAADFIRTTIAEEFARYAEEKDPRGYDFHAIMNLPGSSISFLPHFRGLLSAYPESR
jgi:hypothetical protein